MKLAQAGGNTCLLWNSHTYLGIDNLGLAQRTLPDERNGLFARLSYLNISVCPTYFADGLPPLDPPLTCFACSIVLIYGPYGERLYPGLSPDRHIRR